MLLCSYYFRIKYFVERVVSERTKGLTDELLIKWEGFTKTSWEPKADLPLLTEELLEMRQRKYDAAQKKLDSLRRTLERRRAAVKTSVADYSTQLHKVTKYRAKLHLSGVYPLLGAHPVGR